MAKSLGFVRDDARSKVAAQRDQLLGAIWWWFMCWAWQPEGEEAYRKHQGESAENFLQNMRELNNPMEI